MTITIDVSGLVNGIDDEQLATRRVVEETVKATARDFIRAVIPATPVDTGKARRNWQVNFLAPATQVLNGVDTSPGGEFTVAEQIARIQQYRFGPVVWIVNNVDYIVRLNEGSSPQARPAGFVERALNAATVSGPSSVGESI